MVRYGARKVYAHVLSYLLRVGPVPDGMELDHLCKVTRCVRPSHLDPVPPKENLARADSRAKQLARRNKCAQGHRFTPENTYRYGNTRQCRRCNADNAARRRATAASTP